MMGPNRVVQCSIFVVVRQNVAAAVVFLVAPNVFLVSVAAMPPSHPPPRRRLAASFLVVASFSAEYAAAGIWTTLDLQGDSAAAILTAFIMSAFSLIRRKKQIYYAHTEIG